ncbi:hypothetical protein [Microbacterium sp. MMO-32]|uniref:hypothetical protein n=1 Tax=Microbacterium sp. MMO-32 TaxID=3081279 RepID=UPI00301AABD1
MIPHVPVIPHVAPKPAPAPRTTTPRYNPPPAPKPAPAPQPKPKPKPAPAPVPKPVPAPYPVAPRQQPTIIHQDSTPWFLWFLIGQSAASHGGGPSCR